MAKIIDVEVEEVETQETNPEEVKTEKKERKPFRKVVGEWLIADEHPKAKKVGRIVTGVVAGACLVGAAALAFFHGGGGADVPELPDGLDGAEELLPDGTSDLADVAETLVE